LKKGQRYSIHQLLYGLMLPSGNDASLALAVWAGKVLTMKGWRTK
jgi:D-alanyl-D-alanine carboxypeptidase